MLASYGLYLVSRWMPILGRYSFTLQPFAPKQRAPEFDFTHANSPFMQSSYPEPFFLSFFPPKLHRTCCSTLPSLNLSQNKDTNFAPWGWKVGFCACITGQHLHSRSWLNRLEQKLWNTKTCYESMAKMETRQGIQFMNSPA